MLVAAASAGDERCESTMPPGKPLAAILDDGPVPQARKRSGRKLRRAQEEGHQSIRKPLL